MEKFSVAIPVNMRLFVSVEAENEKEAIKKAVSECDIQFNPKSELGYEMEEWDVYEKMMEGNFWYGIIYEADAEIDNF